MCAVENVVPWKGEKLAILEGEEVPFSGVPMHLFSRSQIFHLSCRGQIWHKLYGHSYPSVRDATYFLSFPGFLNKELLLLNF